MAAPGSEPGTGRLGIKDSEHYTKELTRCVETIDLLGYQLGRYSDDDALTSFYESFA